MIAGHDRMHDTLDYFRYDPIHRQYRHDRLTFRVLCANAENYVLPLSHDEVVHGKGSLLGRMPENKDKRKRKSIIKVPGSFSGLRP